MKLRQTRYTPKKKRNPLLKALMSILIVLLLVMWLNMERFGFEFSDMLIATGIALILLSIANANRKMEKDIEISDKQLEEMRDKIGKDEYSTSSMYFDEELK
ncbi:MAG: hypothetical protein ACI4SF_01620 [Oscillospiraceae bacterium]